MGIYLVISTDSVLEDDTFMYLFNKDNVSKIGLSSPRGEYNKVLG